MSQTPNKVTNIHESLQRAAFKGERTETTNFTTRLPVHIREVASEICERNGTTLGAFLSQCTKDLVADYTGLQDH